MAGEDIQVSTKAEVVSAPSTITATSGNVVTANQNQLQAFNPVPAAVPGPLATVILSPAQDAL